MSSVLQTPGKRHKLIKTLHEKILIVEDAINQVSTIRNSLEDNAEQVKSEIYASISSHFEQLRNRQEQLLRQVDVLTSNQMSLLRTQHAKLYHCLGNLQSSLQCVEDQANDLNFTTVVTKDMESVTRMKSQSQPFFAAHFNEETLKLSIQNFGCIEMSSTLLSFPPLEDSMCLPSRVEEYEDGDHHVLYKTLQDLKFESDNSLKVKVAFPKVSDHINDWLQSEKNEVHANSEPDNWEQDKIKTDAERVKCLQLQKWLCQSQNVLEDFQMLECPSESSVTDSIEIVSPSTLSLATTAEKAVKATINNALSTSDWLSKSYNSFYGHVDNGACSNPHTVCCRSYKNVEIENLGSMSCLNINDECKGENDVWLTNCAPTDQQQLIPTVASVCRSNELCSSLHDCICDQNCAVEHLQQSANMETNEESARKAAQLIAPMLNILYGTTAEWIAGGAGVFTSMPTEHDNSPTDIKNWLASNRAVGSGFALSLGKSSADESSWLFDSGKQIPAVRNMLQDKITAMFQSYFQPFDINAWLTSCEGDATSSIDLVNNLKWLNISGCM